jgi:hypothetical protein
MCVQATFVLSLIPVLSMIGFSCHDRAMQEQAYEKTPESSAILWSPSSSGLRFGIGPGTNRRSVAMYLENTGKAQLDVMSHVAAQEKHLDWYTLQLRDASGATRTLKLLGPRRESGPVKVALKPGARIEHAVDLAFWAERPINGGKPLVAGTYQVSATYSVPSGDGRWTGKLDAGPLTLVIAY